MMKKSAFTLIELLVVIAIIAILAAILFPVFAQAKAAAKKTADLSNVKQNVTCTFIYTTDSDDMYPLQSGQDSGTGAWGYNYVKQVPYNWPIGRPQNRYDFAQSFYLNTVYPYTKNYQIYLSTGIPTASVISGYQTDPTTVGPQNTSYAFNGLLTAYSSTAVAEPAILPIITEQNGNVGYQGFGFANPALTCATANQSCSYVPTGASGCAATNGGTSAIYQTEASSSYWMYSEGANWGLCDGHAKFRPLGRALAPANTDYTVDPMTQYDNTGRAGYYWEDGCHPWLFRPDYQP